MNKTNHSKVAFALCAASLGALTGCVGYVDGPRGGVYVQPASVQIESGGPVEDDYVYYPGYQVYYSRNRHQYVYLEGRRWVTRPAPPRVSADVLFASPSVRLDFHDSPARHHAAVVRQYPKHWAPSEQGHGKKGANDEGRSGRNDKGRKDHE